MSNAPLQGITVVEICAVGPAPCAGMMFADMGAEVILVERKSPNQNAIDTGSVEDIRSVEFIHRGKKSIEIDLKKPEGVELVLKLIEKADVLIEGFRPGVMERLGLGPESCLQRNPKLVYGRMTGWGQEGPLAQSAGHDPNYIALSGALWYGGDNQRAPKAPLTVAGDVGGGTMILLWGLLCALFGVQRTGKGQVVDAAITDGSAYISSILWMMHCAGLLQDELGISWPDGGAPFNNTYACADGKYITICSVEPGFYQELIARLNLIDNPLFRVQSDTSKWPEAKSVLEEIFLSKTRDEWCSLLEGTDVCFAPVLNFPEATKHPHNIARKTFLNIDGVIQPAPAPKLSRNESTVGIPPKRGFHTELLLQGVGLSVENIERLRRNAVI